MTRSRNRDFFAALALAMFAMFWFMVLAGVSHASVVTSADTLRQYPQGSVYTTNANALAAAGTSDVVRVTGSSGELQVDGTCTSLSGQLQRSAFDPNNVPTGFTLAWAPVGSAQSAVNPSTGVAPVSFTEAGVGFYRYNATTVTGGTCNVSLSAGAK